MNTKEQVRQLIENYKAAKENVRIAKEELNSLFNEYQTGYLCSCVDDGKLTTDELLVFARPDLNEDQMDAAYKCYMSNVPADTISKMIAEKFDRDQIIGVINAYNSLLTDKELNIVVNKKYDGYQMNSVIKLFKSGIPSEYQTLILNPLFDNRQMNMLIKLFVTSDITQEQKLYIANPLYNYEQMNVLYQAFTFGYSVDKIASLVNPQMDYRLMTIVINSVDRFPIEYVKSIAEQTDLTEAKNMTSLYKFYDYMISSILSKWKEDNHVIRDIKFQLCSDGELIIYDPYMLNGIINDIYMSMIKKAVPIVKKFTIIDPTKTAKEKVENKPNTNYKPNKTKPKEKPFVSVREGSPVNYRHSHTDLCLCEFITPVISKVQFLDDIRYNPREFKEVAKYSECIPCMHIDDTVHLCESGLYEDVSEIENLLKGFGYSYEEEKEDKISKKDLKEIMDYFGLN